MKKRMKDEKGFTLIELIIVIAILAILAGVAVPNIIGAVANSRRAADVANAKIILNAAVQVQAEQVYADIADTDITAANFTAADATDYEKALYRQLNETIPEPSFQGDHFVLVVENAGAVLKVELDTGVEVAPNPANIYNQN